MYSGIASPNGTPEQSEMYNHSKEMKEGRSKGLQSDIKCEDLLSDFTFIPTPLQSVDLFIRVPFKLDGNEMNRALGHLCAYIG